jgi:hypothetical protein
MRRYGLGYLLLIAFLFGIAPPGYAAMFALARQEAALSEAEYELATQVIGLVLIPGRLLLSVTPYDGALASTHMRFWRGLIALVVANAIGWFVVLVGIVAMARGCHQIVRRTARRSPTPSPRG